MYRIGIDVGSTYTKYCIMKDGQIIHLFCEPTPLRQKVYFEEKCQVLKADYPGAVFISCGYGKHNIPAMRNINELTALARGGFYAVSETELILDIGGQDTKIISQRNGRLQRFFLNDKCAAGSGMFFQNSANLLGVDFDEICLAGVGKPELSLSSVCAVFAQSEIVGLLADNQEEKKILEAVIWQILMKAKPLLGKVSEGMILLSGGLTQIGGFQEFAEQALGWECRVSEHSVYLSAIGCAVGE